MLCPYCDVETTPAGDGWTVCEECGWSNDSDLVPYETEPVDKYIERIGRKRRRV